MGIRGVTRSSNRSSSRAPGNPPPLAGSPGPFQRDPGTTTPSLSSVHPRAETAAPCSVASFHCTHCIVVRHVRPRPPALTSSIQRWPQRARGKAGGVTLCRRRERKLNRARLTPPISHHPFRRLVRSSNGVHARPEIIIPFYQLLGAKSLSAC